jgi:hypothetical protein
LASLILLARYGLPPLSGWFSNISCLCFLRRASLFKPRSLSRSRQSQVPNPHHRSKQ